MAWAMLCSALCMLGLGASATAQWPRIITINPPGAGTAAGLGTQGPGINPEGAITGFYSDSKNVMHGFLRARDGRITTFEAPGAGSETVTGFQFTTIPWVYGGQGTYAIAINPAGAIAGFYYDSNNVAHGFLRSPDGKFTTINAPSPYVGTAEGQGTSAANINPAGVIAGYTVDAGGVFHGFVRARDGKIRMFDAPHAGTGAGQATVPEWASCINSAGAIVGEYFDASSVSHGFVRAPDGKITEFDVPGAGATPGSFEGTYAWSINDAGAVTADYIDADSVDHGYVRAPDGKITKFDVPGGGTGAGQGTVPEGINTAGAIAGNYIDDSGANHGFVRSPDGKFTYFDVPGAGTGSGQGTIPLTDNPEGAITGTYIDDGNVIHGFLRLPGPPWIW
jgi:uncharacterized membrane protein